MAANNGVAVIAVDPAYTRAGAPSTGSSTSADLARGERHHAAASSSDDADSDIGHDDGKGVTRHEQCIVTRELRSVVSGDRRRTPNRRTGRQVGSAIAAEDPSWRTGTSGDEATEDRSWSPAGRNQFCSVFRNGGDQYGNLAGGLDLVLGIRRVRSNRAIPPDRSLIAADLPDDHVKAPAHPGSSRPPVGDQVVVPDRVGRSSSFEATRAYSPHVRPS